MSLIQPQNDVLSERGFFFIPTHTNEPHFMGNDFKLACLQLENLCDRFLTEFLFQYTVIYSVGKTANGRIGWGNLDLSHEMLDELDAMEVSL